MALLTSLNLATADQLLAGPPTARLGRTGIDKRPVDGLVATGADQLEGDSIVNRRHHGGPDQAVYAYAAEDARWWAAELPRDVGPGAFGENLTTSGLDVTGAVIGEVWQVGTAHFEVACPRIPCRVFARFWDVGDLVKRFTRAERPGAYLRIARAGRLGAGDEITVLSRPAHGVTIAETFRALTGHHALAPRLLEAPQLPAKVHATARTWLAGTTPAKS